MLRLLLKSGVSIFSAFLLLAGNAAAQSAGVPSQTTPSAAAAPKAGTSSQRHSAKHSSTKTPQPEVVQPPPPPPTPEQMAPVAPEVSYQGGQLTIKSQNATLAQVLRSVQAKTGGSFEVPGSANSDRVVAQLGPGQPRDVLAKLLDGSKFNYIILGSATQPGTVQKLILTPRQNIPTTNTAQNRPVQPQGQEPQPEDDYNPPEPTPVEDNSANEAQPPGGPYRPGGFVPNQPPQNAEFPQQQPPGDNNGQPQQGVKTPEQLLQELQRMQQQQQQYQQQLNPANQNPTQPPPQNQPQ